MSETKKQVAQEEETFLSPGVRSTNIGSPIVPRYKRVYDEKLKRNVVKHVDDFNIDEFIQASSNSTELAILKKKFVELGEIPNVSGVEPTYGDLSVMPDNVHELYHMQGKALDAFSKLPDNVKGAFASPDDLLNHIIQGDFTQVINTYVSSQQTKVEGGDNNG